MLNTLRFDRLFGPINFTIVNVKTRPTITGVASYGLSSCSLLQLLSFLNHVHIDSIRLQVSQVHYSRSRSHPEFPLLLKLQYITTIYNSLGVFSVNGHYVFPYFKN